MSASASSSTSSELSSSKMSEEAKTFKELGLDARLLKAVQKKGFETPTPVQEAAIPLALQGRDILARAQTGSGKTLAYALPILHKILGVVSRSGHHSAVGVQAIVLVPTRDLCPQVQRVFSELAQYCSRLLTVYALSGAASALEEQRVRLAETPTVVVATPGRLAQHLKAGHLPEAQELARTLHSVVVDEADLVLSYGYEADVRALFDYLPQRVAQTYMMSATLSSDVENLKRLVLRKPAVIKLDAPSAEATNNLSEFAIEIADNDKYLMMYSLLVLRQLQGKTIVFCNDISRAFRLKLLLERFSIASIVLNSDLPENSRRHITDEFNAGLHTLLIATDHELHEVSEDISTLDDDDQKVDQSQQESKNDADSETESVAGSDVDSASDPDVGGKSSKLKKTPGKKASRDHVKPTAEYGVSRGVDFQNVNVVLNFDFPKSLATYVHRIGRTARAGRLGTALSFISQEDDASLERIRKQRAAEGITVHPFRFQMQALESFRYRVEDLLRFVNRNAIREARINDFKKELINSEKLKDHFQERPADLHLLKHDTPLQKGAIRPHLKHIPDYLLKGSLSGLSRNTQIASPLFPIKTPNRRERRRMNPLKSLTSGLKKGGKPKRGRAKSSGSSRSKRSRRA
ncbi:MAG: DEAD/DEAH box helicase [archaeon]|nr:DEAD/DEAH box helicase [archaeon]